MLKNFLATKVVSERKSPGKGAVYYTYYILPYERIILSNRYLCMPELSQI